MATSAPRKAVLTVVGGAAHERMAAVTLPTFEAYGRRHGYDVIVADPVDGITAPWSKVTRMREALQTHDLVLWVDVDAALSGDAPDVAGYLAHSHTFQALALLTGGEHALLATGVWLMCRRPLAAEFLRDMLSYDQTDARDGLHEAAAIWELLGWTDFEQGCPAADGRAVYALGTLLLDGRWNARGFTVDATPVGDPAAPARPFAYHATGFWLKEQPDADELRVETLRWFVESDPSRPGVAP